MRISLPPINKGEWASMLGSGGNVAEGYASYAGAAVELRGDTWERTAARPLSKLLLKRSVSDSHVVRC